jgi:hypothetical protein
LPSCPPPNIDITPCECLHGFDDYISQKPSAIRCFGKQSLDLVNIFEILDANVNPQNKAFDIFYLNNTSIREIPENVFKEFTFKEIYFDRTTNLTTIDPKAFGESQKTVIHLHAWDTTLNISAGNFDNIKLFDSLKILDYLDFSTSDCPPQQLLGSCQCEKVTEFERTDKHESPVIQCKQLSNSEEIVQIFQNLGSNLKESKRNFLRFKLQDSHIDELPEDLFNGITFSEIIIEDCPKLSLIDKNVFKSIKPFVNKLTINNINKLKDKHQNEDLWYAISSLSNLVNLNLIDVFTEIPDKAFKIIEAQTQWRLKYFKHSNLEDSKGISSIGSYAFYYLPNIEVYLIFKLKCNKF